MALQCRENVIAALTTPSLVQSSMLFISQFKIYLKHSIRIPLLREGGQFRIEAILNLDIPIQDLVACNKCRLFLKVCLLSDITTGDGLYIRGSLGRHIRTAGTKG